MSDNKKADDLKLTDSDSEERKRLQSLEEDKQIAEFKEMVKEMQKLQSAFLKELSNLDNETAKNYQGNFKFLAIVENDEARLLVDDDVLEGLPKTLRKHIAMTSVADLKHELEATLGKYCNDFLANVKEVHNTCAKTQDQWKLALIQKEIENRKKGLVAQCNRLVDKAIAENAEAEKSGGDGYGKRFYENLSLQFKDKRNKIVYLKDVINKLRKKIIKRQLEEVFTAEDSAVLMQMLKELQIVENRMISLETELIALEREHKKEKEKRRNQPPHTLIFQNHIIAYMKEIAQAHISITKINRQVNCDQKWTDERDEVANSEKKNGKKHRKGRNKKAAAPGGNASNELNTKCNPLENLNATWPAQDMETTLQNDMIKWMEENAKSDGNLRERRQDENIRSLENEIAQLNINLAASNRNADGNMSASKRGNDE